MKEIIDKLNETFDFKEIWGNILKFLPNLIVAIIVLLFFYLIWIIAIRIIILILKKSKIEKTVGTFIITLTKYVLMTFAIIISLSQIGINITSLLASLGVIGITIGYALRESISNIISGIYIFWERPFVIGDLIEIEGNYGKVYHITLRCTTISTPDGKIVSIPNSFIIEKVLTTYVTFQSIRIETKFTVAANENIDFIRKVLLDSIVDKLEYAQDKNSEIVISALNIDTIDVVFRVWIKDEKQHLRLANELRENVYKTLNNNNIVAQPETIFIKIKN